MSGPPYRSILFLCVANSARSQMAEGLARQRLGAGVTVQSAGSQPTRVNPFAIRAMSEVGVDLSGHHSKSVETINPAAVDLIITLCAEEVCPAFLGGAEHLHWPLQDPDREDEDLTDNQRLTYFRVARDDLRDRIAELSAQPLTDSPVV